MGASNSAQGPVNSSSQQTSEDPSLSIVSIDGAYFSVEETESADFIIQGGLGAGSRELLTLVKPGTRKSDKLTGPLVFLSDSELVKLDSSSKKKNKKCCCFGQRSKRKQEMLEITSYNSLDGEYGSPEIFANKSAADMVVNPLDIYPLSVVTSLSLSPSEARAMKKKIRRTIIPDKPDKPMSLWGLLKSAIGKDLSKMPLPVNFGEPLSMLQRLTEDYEYSSILDRAAHLTDSMEQMASVAAFTVSSYASCAYRTAKPFNPLLGETYECDRTDDYGWRVIAEQVCHHPPIASLHCESAMGWVQWQQFTMKSNFRGTYLEIHPLGVAHLRFKKDDNHYTWRKVSTIVRNLYMGKVYIEQDGEMDILNHTTGEKCRMKYSSGGMFSRDRSVHFQLTTSVFLIYFLITKEWQR